jgi:hypothetical protein
MSYYPHLQLETDPISEKFSFPIIQISGRHVQSRNPAILKLRDVAECIKFGVAAII